MDSQRWQRMQALFETALDIPQAQRQAWLAAACGDDPLLASQVQAMLDADTAGDEGAARVARSVEQAMAGFGLEAGQRVGAWAVDSLLARGGMGAVYRAHRSDQAYQQEAIIKVVALPMNRGLQARFRRERQMLADLSHPYIARLLDGGTLPGGEPYLVMEYVRGCDIASWCQRQRLGLSARLALIGRVCEAVQFAHASLIVHRDIKPANVLIDESGMPRLLDFGIASLLDTGEPDRQRPRAVADNRLTSDYASPEQRRGEAVTTASDIYSLGALLYRLLTGQPPRFDQGQLIAPTALVASEPTIGPVGRIIRADLDAVIARSLADDPNHRYPTVQALVDDLARVRSLRPVRARPVGRLGQLQRAVQRNRVLSATLAASGLLILAFSIGISLLALNLNQQRERAVLAATTTEQVSDFVFELFDGADPEVSPGDTPSARELLDRGTARIHEELHDQDRIRARLLHRMGRAYQGLGAYEQARTLLTDGLAAVDASDQALYWRLMVDLADLERLLGERAAARSRLDQVIEQLAGTQRFAQSLASAYNNRGLIAAELEQYAQAETLAQQALAVELPDDREHQVLRARYRHNLALTLGRQGRHDEAIEVLEAVIGEKRRTLGPAHPSTLRSMEVLAGNHRERGDLDRAAATFEAVLARTVSLHGEPSAAEARVNNSLGNVHHDRGDYARAEASYRRALDFHEARPAADPLTHAFVVNNLAALLEDRGNLSGAETLFRHSLALRRQLAGDDELLVIHARSNLARVLVSRQRQAEAGALLAEVDGALARHYPDNQLRRWQLDWQQARLAALAHPTEADGSGNGSGQDNRIQPLLDQLEATWPDRARLRARATLDAAAIHLHQGAYGPAQERAEQARALLDGQFAADHPMQLQARVLHASALAGQGDMRASRAIVMPLQPALIETFDPAADILAQAEKLSGASRP